MVVVVVFLIQQKLRILDLLVNVGQKASTCSISMTNDYDHVFNRVKREVVSSVASLLLKKLLYYNFLVHSKKSKDFLEGRKVIDSVAAMVNYLILETNLLSNSFRVCHWATGLLGEASISDQCRNSGPF